jgi:Rieske Fe-S protein
MKLEDSCIGRRRFIASLLAGGTAALGAGAGGPLLAYVADLREVPLPEFLVLEKPDFDLAPGESKLVIYGRVPVLLFREPREDAELKVFWATCTHFDCTVSYQVEGNYMLCACHDGRYDVDGKIIEGPQPAPLPPVYTRAWGDKLIIALEEENLEKAMVEA